MESSQGYGASESHMLKVAALKLFHPAISSVLFGTGIIIATQGEGRACPVLDTGVGKLLFFPFLFEGLENLFRCDRKGLKSYSNGIINGVDDSRCRG